MILLVDLSTCHTFAFFRCQISTSSETPRSNKTAGAFMFSFFLRGGRGNVLGKYETTMWKDIGELIQPQKNSQTLQGTKRIHSSLLSMVEWWKCLMHFATLQAFSGVKRMVQQLEDDPMDVADVSLLWNECCLHRYRKYWKKDAIRKEFFSTSSWKNATFLKATLPTMYRVPYFRKEGEWQKTTRSRKTKNLRNFKNPNQLEKKKHKS